MNDTRSITAFADWQIISEDVDADIYLSDLLTKGVSDGKIKTHEVYVTSGYGLSYVFFSVTLDMTLSEEASLIDVKAVITQILNDIVHDTDVSVRWTQIGAPL